MIRRFLLCFFALCFYSHTLLATETTPLKRDYGIKTFFSTVDAIDLDYTVSDKASFDFAHNKSLLENAILTVSEGELSTPYHYDYMYFLKRFRLDLMHGWFCCCFSKPIQLQFEDRLELAKAYKKKLADRLPLHFTPK